VGPQRGADTTRPEGAAPKAPTAPAAAPKADAGNAAVIASLNKNSCLACHGMDTKLVGPGFREIAKKYQGRADGEAYLAGKIRAGGAGVWGAIPMPAQTLPDAEVTAIARWLSAGAPK